ncbi:MAG: ATP-NAD kinase [Candidatus Lokiarchaeum sp. GC14_75]|nr:MAG: ATP-NAD kinase [Candidatus Lokiarchaeum sp. GC14_75]
MNSLNKFKIGLIINPISGMGGSVGLKGTDGKSILKKAIKLGAKPSASSRARELLENLEWKKSDFYFITCSGLMGEFVLKEMNFDFKAVSHPIFRNVETLQQTSAQQTMIAAKIMAEITDLKLIVFIGGDGTARDIMNSIGKNVPCLGVPGGVKIYSSVFSLNPRAAASLILQYLWGEIPLKESEVLDIDEEEYRNGNLICKLYGYLLTPVNPEYSQYSKMESSHKDLSNQERIARKIFESLEENVYYLIGPGTTTKAITNKLKNTHTILGVDLLLNKKLIAYDLNENQILEYITGKKTKIIISLIGRQGFLFGRGNLQFTPKILRMISPKNIIVIATKYKLQNINNQILRLDTRDPELDKLMKGFYRVHVDYDEIRICEAK